MAGFTPTELIWMNGRLVAWAEAQVHVTAHGLQYGTGVFEGVRSYDTPEGPALFRLEPHLRRFKESASFYEIPLPYSVDELASAAIDLVRRNRLENAYLRPLAFFDAHTFSLWPSGCPVTVAIVAVPGRAYIQGGPESGVRVTVSTVRRIDPATLPPFVKACGHYTNSVRAVQDAIRRGYDEALMLNTSGDVAEGSGENLFLVKDGTVITNDVDASILPGITRDSVLHIARDLGLPVAIRPIGLTDVHTADELFFTGTAVEVTPIREVDGRVYGGGLPGPITRRIQHTYFEAVHGRLPKYRPWLSFTGQLQRT